MVEIDSEIVFEEFVVIENDLSHSQENDKRNWNIPVSDLSIMINEYIDFSKMRCHL